MSSSRKSLFFNRCQQAPVPRTKLIDRLRVKFSETKATNKVSDSRCSYKRLPPTGDSHIDSLSSHESTVPHTGSNAPHLVQFLRDLEDILLLAALDRCASKLLHVPAPQVCLNAVKEEDMWKTKRSHSFNSPHSVVKEQEEQQNSVEFQATQLWDAMVTHLECHIGAGRRMRSFRWHQDCFHGSEAIDCLKTFFTKILHRTGVERQQLCTLLGRFNSWGIIEAVASRDQNTAFRECNLYRLTYQHFWRSEERDVKTKSLHRRSNSIPSLAPGDLEDSGLNSPASIQSTSSEEKIKSLPRTCSSLSLDHGFHDDQPTSDVDEKEAETSSSDSETEAMDHPHVEAKEQTQARRYSRQRSSEAARRAMKDRNSDAPVKRMMRQRSMLFQEQQTSNQKLSMKRSGSCGALYEDTPGGGLAATNSAEGCERSHPKATTENKRPGYSKKPVVRQTSKAEACKMSSSEEDNAVNASSRSAATDRDLRRQERLARHQAKKAALTHARHGQERRPPRKQSSQKHHPEAVTNTSSNHHSSRRKHCDLYKRLAASGQLSSSPVAYGDFGALAMSDVAWQRFCFSQDTAAPRASVGLFSTASQVDEDMLIVRYGFV